MALEFELDLGALYFTFVFFDRERIIAVPSSNLA